MKRNEVTVVMSTIMNSPNHVGGNAIHCSVDHVPSKGQLPCLATRNPNNAPLAERPLTSLDVTFLFTFVLFGIPYEIPAYSKENERIQGESKASGQEFLLREAQ